jgi:hypothetical protein
MKHYLLLLLLIINGSFFAQGQDFFDAQPTLDTWVKKRVLNAKMGTHEIVEFPMAVRTKAWGCRCPFHYIGISTNTVEGPWMSPILPKGFPVSDEKGYSLIVKGFFTGKQVIKDYRKKADEPKDWVYTLPEFKVLSWRKNELDYEVDPPKILK